MGHPDPHAPLWLDDPQHPYEPVPLHIYRMSQEGFKIWETKLGWFAKRGNKVTFPDGYNRVLRVRVWKRGGKVCLYCGERTYIVPPEGKSWAAATIEHRKPLSQGGTWKLKNLGCACYRCNRSKGDLLEEEFLELLQRYPVDQDPINWSRIRQASGLIMSRRAKARNQSSAEATSLDVPR